MQANYSVPGIIREEVFPTVQPALVTGVPVFLGRVAKAKESGLRSLKLWTEFASYFAASSKTLLAAAVRGFFENGGQWCYVLPIAELSQEALSNALIELESLDKIDLVCAPDLATLPIAEAIRLQQLVLEHCDRLGNRFAILDAVNDSIGQIKDQQSQLSSSNAGSNGALYAPWVKLVSKEVVPPCGHIAGLYAQRDRSSGVHMPPANLVVEGIIDLSYTIAPEQFRELNPNYGTVSAGVNCLQVLPGRGIRVWGIRTLSRDPDWFYISVRRLFITLFRWIDLNLASAAFEPNDFRLWRSIERELTVYLESLLQKGALKGGLAEQAFYVRCNDTTNTIADREAGRVITEIGLAPIMPNEFITVRFIQGETGVVART
ncbi:phage tail sheath family protein [Leptolyngbya sp. AN03gr2]|uniref:phage tail sheath family protein n=1 Tax=unclassified Leptolyngbya TaxID=2650499 RepID=UPI003D3135E4